MYIQNGICYAGQYQDTLRVTEAKPLRGGMLLVTFSSGEKRLFDTTRLEGSAFAPLADGVITWKDGEIDIAPETVYRDSYPYDN